MAIQFQCPHCHKALRVRDEWAGKKARCPACQKLLTVASPGRGDVEDLAAAALSETPAATGPAPTVEFACMYCDEQVQVPAELAGKQTPCPHCKRIIRVPVPSPSGPRDWRKADQLPSGARRDLGPTPEGAWGTGTSTSRVSSEALVEARAIPVTHRPRTVRERIVLGVSAAVAILLIVVGSVGMVRYQARTRQAQAFARAEEALAGKGLPLPAGLERAELFRASGEYHLRDQEIGAAYDRFKEARAWLARPGEPSLERDLFILDLAMAQTEFLGDERTVRLHQRYGWQDTRLELERTLLLLGSPEARDTAIQEVSRRLLVRQPRLRVDELANTLPKEGERAELRGAAGLEMLRAGQREHAQDVARVALAPYRARPQNAKAPPARPPAAASLLALLVALDQQTVAEKEISPLPAPKGEVDEEVRVGYALGWALCGKIQEARALAQRPGSPVARLRALVAIVEAELEKDPKAAAADVAEALRLFSGELDANTVSPWLLFRLVTAGLRSGTLNNAEVVAGAVTRPEVRRRAQLIALQIRPPQAHLQALAKAAGETPADGLVLELLARLNARAGNGEAVTTQVGTWQPTELRPFGYMGVALGLQDRRQ